MCKMSLDHLVTPESRDMSEWTQEPKSYRQKRKQFRCHNSFDDCKGWTAVD